jgi:hypothetical protein
VKIGDHNYGGGIAPLGDTYRIVINNVMRKSRHTILLGGSLSDSILTNIVGLGETGEVVTVASGPQYVRNVTIANVHVTGD